jgi:hypothetical protein
MASYSGGVHEAEVVAIDGAGNQTAKRWAINVDPEGHISTAETAATLEAAETTTETNTVGPSAIEPGIEGSAEGLAIEEAGGELVATGTETPVTVAAGVGGGFTMEIPEEGAFSVCSESEEEWTEGENGEAIPVTAEAECDPSREQIGNSAGLVPVEVTPLDTATGATRPSLVEENAAISANTASSSDTVIRPLNDGGMVFQMIRDEAAPEGYSYEVSLGEEQVLRAINEQQAEVYNSGHEPAFTITAAAAHDAIGTSVPTTLTVDSRNVITLHVHYRGGINGQQFVYPIVAGTGWEGGFRTIEVEMRNPLGEPEPIEEEDNGEAKVTESGGHTIVRLGAVSAAAFSYPPSQNPPHLYEFSECTYPPLGQIELQPGDAPPEEDYAFTNRDDRTRTVVGGCAIPGSQIQLIDAVAVWGQFHYENGNGVWVNAPEAANCAVLKGGYEKPVPVHCGIQPKSSNTAITARGDFKWPQSGLHPLGPSCDTLYGHLRASAPHKEVEETLWTDLGPGGVGSPCPWPAWPH